MSGANDRTSMWAAEAKVLGLSYGQYVAKFHPVAESTRPPILRAKTCPECGQVFRAISKRHTFCCEACRRRVYNRKYYHSAKENH